MTKEEVDKQNFQALIEKYLDGKTTLEELKLLVNYYESYQQEHVWDLELGSEEVVRKRLLINILEELQNNEVNNVKVIPFYKNQIFKYAAAASIVLLISLTFFFKNKNIIIEDVEVVNTEQPNTIEIGTDKATLTLEDGSHVVLEKGASFQNENIRSNGEEIVYDNEDVKSEVIEYNYLTIPRGGQFFIKLSDGTQVWLNSESQLKYPVNFRKDETRQVELVYGEAYFDVSPSTLHNGTKFKVINNAQEVEVLGTEFNIKAYKDETNIYTTLVEGKVLIDFKGQEKYLVPSQQSNLNLLNDNLAVAIVDVDSEISWKNGIFSFNDKPLKDIMKVISRWYDVDVVFENEALEDIAFIGVLGKDQSLEKILETIKTLSIIKNYEINDKTVTIN